MDLLSLFDFNKNPFENFDLLFKEAQTQKVLETNAMSISTVSKSGQPTIRTVYLKNRYGEGWGFFTNYHGRKGKELDANPQIGANFFWPQASVQIRIDGIVEKLTRQQNEDYFATRQRLSQLGAWASHQSDELKSRAELEARLLDAEKKFAGVAVPCPPHWGGYRILTREIEFWFGVEGRIHERYVYARTSPEKFFDNPADVEWRRLIRNP